MNAEERRAAEALYDRIPREAHAGKLAGFTGGAGFMAAALHALGYHDLRIPPGMESLGITKYALAVVAGIVAAIATGLLLPWWTGVAVFVFTFYAVESRFVFAFPLAVTGTTDPMRESHRMAGAVWATTPRVMGIAWHMLTGGFRGRGFVRSWCVGCLVVVLWFDARRREFA